MKTRPFLWLAAFLLACVAGGVRVARGLGDREEEPAPEIRPIRGRIRLGGNEPFTELVLSDEEGNDWFIEGPARDSLIHRQHEVLVLRGEAEYRDIILASGRRIGVRYILRNVTAAGE
jgi:hypothetical protein